MNKFKVGYLVRVYTAQVDRPGSPKPFTTRVRHINGNIITLNLGEVAHYKQCRKLKPKVKLREFWTTVPGEPGEYIYVREVRKKR